jgi:hypothetical protein
VSLPRLSTITLLSLASFAATSCGYHVGGKADMVPQAVQTISIPTFATITTRYKLVDLLPQDISRDFRSRSRFQIDNNPATADAVLNGTINNVIVYPAVSDPTTGKATSIRIVVLLTVNLIERSTGKVLYSRVNWSVHEDYADAIDPHQFFDESGAAFERLSRDVAHDIVSAVLESF